ncbi:MAG: hypothetical protein QM756_18065 [Polyangiaceae bacterium]
MLLTRDGWVKRQKEIKDTATTRLREGDAVLACGIGSTRASIVFFSSFGTAYTARIIDIPATTGYGEPIQKLFKLKDGERISAMSSLRSARAQATSRRPSRASPRPTGGSQQRRLSRSRSVWSRSSSPARAPVVVTPSPPKAPRSSASIS